MRRTDEQLLEILVRKGLRAVYNAGYNDGEDDGITEGERKLELWKQQVAATPAEVAGLPIEDLDLTERARNCLRRAQIYTIGELVAKTEDDLLAITNFGQKSLDEVIPKLDERGLALRSAE